MVKKKISFNIEEDIHFKVRELALKNRTTATEIYSKWIKEGLKKETNQTRLE